MDIEGIDVAVLYPTRGLQVLAEPNMEPQFAAALARAYNDWLCDFCEKNPDRLLGAGMVSPFDIDEAVVEVKRCVKELGFRAIFMRSNITNGRNWHDDYYEPLWSLLEELSSRLDFMNRLRRPEDRLAITLSPISCCDEPSRSPWSRCWAGQSLFGWRLGASSQTSRSLFRGKLHVASLVTLAPRRRLGARRRCLGERFDDGAESILQASGFVSVEPDEAGVKYVIDYIGTDRLVFSTDYPHGDSKFPHAVESFLKLEITQDDKRKILWDNCAEFYHVQ